MQNRLGEFALIVDPADAESHLASTAAVANLISKLRIVIAAGARALGQGRRKVQLFHSASPEYGSVKFNLVAGVLITGIGVAANVSQVTGVDVRDIFVAVKHLMEPDAAAANKLPAASDDLIADLAFRSGVANLAQAAAESGFKSVRIQSGTTVIELKHGPGPNLRPPKHRSQAAEISRLRERIAALEEEVHLLDDDELVLLKEDEDKQYRRRAMEELEALRRQVDRMVDES